MVTRCPAQLGVPPRNAVLPQLILLGLPTDYSSPSTVPAWLTLQEHTVPTGAAPPALLPHCGLLSIVCSSFRPNLLLPIWCLRAARNILLLHGEASGLFSQRQLLQPPTTKSLPHKPNTSVQYNPFLAKPNLEGTKKANTLSAWYWGQI